MKDDAKLRAGLAAIRESGHRPGAKFNVGAEGGAFELMITALAEDTLEPCGVFVSDVSHICWVLPLPPAGATVLEAPPQNMNIFCKWTDYIMARGVPRPSDLYRHYKGGLYEVVFVALRPGPVALRPGPGDFPHCVVVYESRENGSKGKVWVRRLDNFTERITLPRFAREVT